MKSSIITFLLFAFAFSGHAQQNNTVVIGNIDSIHSQILKEQRKFWVHLPASANDGQHPHKKYPVVYLLDASWNFTGVVGMIDLLTSVNGNSFFPEMIVVGIPNTNRTRDLTPTHVTEGLWVDSNMVRNSGGGESFTKFLEQELIPHIDSLYPSTSYRMMIGHSLGGLMAINTLLYHTALFRSYIVIDPSMWWDRQKLLHETAPLLKTGSYSGISLFLAMAHTQSPDIDTTMMQRDSTEGTIHPRSILQLSRYLMTGNQHGLKASFKYYDEETHASVPLMATYDALHFIFKDYPLNIRDLYFSDSTFQLAAFLKHHYETITSEYGFTSDDGRDVLPPEDLVNNLGFFVLGKKQYAKAMDMFKMNIANYPAGSVAYSYLGDVYAAKGEKSNAIACYKKSLSLKESNETRKKAENLMGR